MKPILLGSVFGLKQNHKFINVNKPNKMDIVTKHTSELTNRVDMYDHKFLTEKNFWATVQ